MFSSACMVYIGKTKVRDIDHYSERFQDNGQIWPLFKLLNPTKWSKLSVEIRILGIKCISFDHYSVIGFDKSARVYQDMVN